MNRFGGSDGLRSNVTEDDFGGFRIVIPAARHWFLRLFLPVWLCGWAAGEFTVSMILMSGKNQGETLFLVVWLVLWTIGGMATMFILAWNWTGREVIVLSGEGMLTQREIGRFSRSKSFELNSIRNFRYAPVIYNPFARDSARMFRQFGLDGGTIAFDDQPPGGFNPKTHRFGDGLSEIEARRLILTLQERFKFPEGMAIEPLPVQHG